MTRTLFFRTLLRKFSEITNNKPIFSQYNIFYNYEYFFFQSTFWSLFNHCQKSQSNQEKCSLCCSSPCFRVLLCSHYGPLQCFSTYSRKLKEIRVLRPIFPDYVISCDYVLSNKLTRKLKNKQLFSKIIFTKPFFIFSFILYLYSFYPLFLFIFGGSSDLHLFRTIFFDWKSK